jgi:putative component of membrane protein insertase Oxa1/YidC/SpoIIIJ protein YidD
MKNILVKLILLLILFNLIASCTYSHSIQAETDVGADLLSSMVRFYRGPLNHLSAVRYGECPMSPSDSEYSLQSIKKHGMFAGCEIRLSPRVFVNGKWKTYDPVGKNDFWWSDK